MDTKAEATAGGWGDQIFRGVAIGICVGLVDCILILLPITVVKVVMVMMGIDEMDAILAAVQTPAITVPIVLGANAGLVCYGVLRWIGRRRLWVLRTRLSHGGAVAMGAATTCA